MKPEEAIKKIAELLGAKFSETPAPTALKDYPTADGSMITIDGEIAPGSAVTCAMGDGTTMPCPDGTVTLADGTVITVQSGVIVDVKPAAPAGDMSAEVKTLADRIAKLEELLNTTMASHKKESDFYAEKQKEALETLTEAIKEIAGSASTPPAETPKHPTFGRDKTERFAKISETIKNLKK